MFLIVAVAQGALAHDVSLAGTSWVMADGSGRSITFSSGGRVSGFAGCNRFFGTYTQSGDNLRIKALGSTRMGCFKSKGASDGAFLAMLASTRAYTLSSSGLHLLTRARKAIMSLKRK
jgi:heat shock protein HslJ